MINILFTKNRFFRILLGVSCFMASEVCATEEERNDRQKMFDQSSKVGPQEKSMDTQMYNNLICEQIRVRLKGRATLEKCNEHFKNSLLETIESTSKAPNSIEQEELNRAVLFYLEMTSHCQACFGAN